MSATTVAAAPVTETAVSRRTRPAPAPIPYRRLLAVEARKMFDTRSGFWLMASIVIASVLATGLTILLGDRDDLTFDSFAAAVGAPMSVVLPMIGILAVTSEWSQRTALTTFTLVPSRARVIGAKLVDIVVIGVVSMFIALGVGAFGNVIAASVSGIDPVWDISTQTFAQIVLANELGMLLGFVLGLVIRNSPGAIVGYFVFTLVLPNLASALASVNDWWAENAAWFDQNQTRFMLFDETLTTEQWAQLGVTSVLWILIPMAIGLRMMLKAEVK